MLLSLALSLLIIAALAGIAMARGMSALFGDLEAQDPDLWRDLGQPSLKIRSPAYSLRANEMMFSGCPALDRHPKLSEQYRKARRLWYIYFLAGVFSVLLLFAAGVTNAQ